MAGRLAASPLTGVDAPLKAGKFKRQLGRLDLVETKALFADRGSL
jgi:hypothetical protein